ETLKLTEVSASDKLENFRASQELGALTRMGSRRVQDTNNNKSLFKFFPSLQRLFRCQNKIEDINNDVETTTTHQSVSITLDNVNPVGLGREPLTLKYVVEGCNKIIYCATARSTITGDLNRVDHQGVYNISKAFQDYNNKLAQIQAGKSSKSKLLLSKFKSGESLQGWEESVDALIKCVMQEIAFSQGKLVAVFTIYKCLLHWKSFEAERTSVFDSLIQMIGSAIEYAGSSWDELKHIRQAMGFWYVSQDFIEPYCAKVITHICRTNYARVYQDLPVKLNRNLIDAHYNKLKQNYHMYYKYKLAKNNPKYSKLSYVKSYALKLR
ncbi:hypothetical protein GIB67_037146, partial [Kingdonia uniflora]